MRELIRELRAVIWLELTLFTRRRSIWIAIAWIIFQGANASNAVRQNPLFAWSILANAAFLPVIFLVVITGDQVARDRALRVDGVLFATPIRTASYVWGKYLADLLGLLGLSFLFVFAAVMADRFANWQDAPYFGSILFPPLGIRPYLAGWVWLMIVPLVACSALMLAGTTVAHGQRILAYAAVAALLYLPTVAPTRLDLVDLQSLRLAQAYGIANLSLAALYQAATGRVPPAHAADSFNILNHNAVSLDGSPPIAATRLMPLIACRLPPAFPPVFYWNRVVFLALAVLFVMGTGRAVGRHRHGL
jgi:hypothetical protein